MVRAETNLAIAKTRLAVEDEAKSYDERIKALDTAIKLEQETIDEQLRLAKEREAIITAQVAQKAKAWRRTCNADENVRCSSNSKPRPFARKSASKVNASPPLGNVKPAGQMHGRGSQAHRGRTKGFGRRKSRTNAKPPTKRLQAEKKELEDEQKAKDAAAEADRSTTSRSVGPEQALQRQRELTFGALGALQWPQQRVQQARRGKREESL